MLPHYGKEGVDAEAYQSPASVSQTLPIRLVDYFVSATLSFVDVFTCLCMYFATVGVDTKMRIAREKKMQAAEKEARGPRVGRGGG